VFPFWFATAAPLSLQFPTGIVAAVVLVAAAVTPDVSAAIVVVLPRVTAVAVVVVPPPSLAELVAVPPAVSNLTPPVPVVPVAPVYTPAFPVTVVFISCKSHECHILNAFLVTCCPISQFQSSSLPSRKLSPVFPGTLFLYYHHFCLVTACSKFSSI
jgi:hypothetical protein